MQQPHLTTYADIVEVRTMTGAGACNQLLAEGWLGVYPLATVADMTQEILMESSKNNRISSGTSGGWLAMSLVGSGNRHVSKRTLFDRVEIQDNQFWDREDIRLPPARLAYHEGAQPM